MTEFTLNSQHGDRVAAALEIALASEMHVSAEFMKGLAKMASHTLASDPQFLIEAARAYEDGVLETRSRLSAATEKAFKAGRLSEYGSLLATGLDLDVVENLLATKPVPGLAARMAEAAAEGRISGGFASASDASDLWKWKVDEINSRHR